MINEGSSVKIGGNKPGTADANVFVSYLTGRHAKQYNAAHALLQEAEDGNIVAILPQFVVFEVSYVLQSLYNVSGERLASTIRAVVSFPGVQIVDECPWKRVLELWPDPLEAFQENLIETSTRCQDVHARRSYRRRTQTNKRPPSQ